MKLTRDTVRNVAYLSLRQPDAEMESIRLSDDLLIDIAADGTICGIEFLNADRQLGDKSRLHVELFQDKAGAFRWRLVSADGATLGSSSEGYPTKAEAQTAIDLLKEFTGEVEDLTPA